MRIRSFQIAPSESDVVAIGPARVTVIPHSPNVVWISLGATSISESAKLPSEGQPYVFEIGPGEKMVAWCDQQHKVPAPEDRITAMVSVVIQ